MQPLPYGRQHRAVGPAMLRKRRNGAARSQQKNIRSELTTTTTCRFILLRGDAAAWLVPPTYLFDMVKITHLHQAREGLGRARQAQVT